MYLDLHTHSYFSDSELSPEEIINKARDKKTSILSITDHNFLPDTASIKTYAEKNQIQYIDGVEISILYRMPGSNFSLHILGYGRQLNREILNKNLQRTIDGYNRRAIAIIDKINKLFPGLRMDFQSLRLAGHEAYVSRNTIARIVAQHLKGNITVKDVLRQYVFIEQEDDTWMMTPKESFQLIASAGGISVLAHSGRELRKLGHVAYEEMLASLVKEGLLGLEVYYPKHSEDEVITLKNLGRKLGLYITGGSDWHGVIYTPEVSIGCEIPAEDISPFLRNSKIAIL